MMRRSRFASSDAAAGPGVRGVLPDGRDQPGGGKGQRAEECFHKAVYLDPGHDEALLALALIAERRGDAAAAAGFRRRAKRAELEEGSAVR